MSVVARKHGSTVISTIFHKQSPLLCFICYLFPCGTAVPCAVPSSQLPLTMLYDSLLECTILSSQVWPTADTVIKLFFIAVITNRSLPVHGCCCSWGDKIATVVPWCFAFTQFLDVVQVPTEVTTLHPSFFSAVIIIIAVASLAHKMPSKAMYL